MQTVPMWIDLDGAVNARDVGGLPLTGGGVVRPHRLIRTDNLQDLSGRDIRTLIDGYDVRSVADLRTSHELKAEGPGPLTREPGVEFEHHSMFVERDDPLEVADTDAGPIVLPWHERHRPDGKRGAVAVYLGYIGQRPDSVLGTLRLIARSPGATLVHCAAGKDRTGVVVGLALDAVGVERAAIVADFARTADHLPQLLARLASSSTYSREISVDDPGRHEPRAATMDEFLDRVGSDFGGTQAWLAAHGWTSAEQQALTAKLTSD